MQQARSDRHSMRFPPKSVLEGNASFCIWDVFLKVFVSSLKVKWRSLAQPCPNTGYLGGLCWHDTLQLGETLHEAYWEPQCCPRAASAADDGYSTWSILFPIKLPLLCLCLFKYCKLHQIKLRHLVPGWSVWNCFLPLSKTTAKPV